jgi:hypothetical protein
LNSTASCAASAAEAAASPKLEKYAEIDAQYLFVPLAFEAFGPINQAGRDFLFSASTLFISATHSGTCQHKFLTSRDVPRVYFLFINFSAFGK